MKRFSLTQPGLAAGLLALGLTTTALAETPADETARAITYAAEACRCLFENYDAVNEQSTGMKICLDQANTSHGIPADPTETVSYELEGTTMTVPKLFTTDEANLAYATNQNACTLRFSTALLAFQGRTWSQDSICMTQCAEEGALKSLCTSVCMAASLPAAPDESDAAAPAAPASCEDQCSHLSGRSQYACQRNCEKEK